MQLTDKELVARLRRSNSAQLVEWSHDYGTIAKAAADRIEKLSPEEPHATDDKD